MRINLLNGRSETLRSFSWVKGLSKTVNNETRIAKLLRSFQQKHRHKRNNFENSCVSQAIEKLRWRYGEAPTIAKLRRRALTLASTRHLTTPHSPTHMLASRYRIASSADTPAAASVRSRRALSREADDAHPARIFILTTVPHALRTL